MKLYGVYGASGFGREVMPLLRAQLADEIGASFVFIDDAATESTINGHKCLTFEDFCRTPAQSRIVAIAIGDGRIRRKLAEKCTEKGIEFIGIRAQNCLTLDEAKIAEGSILCAFSMITSNVVIGRHFHGNIYSYVAHDCIIGDFVTFAPGVMCNGNIYVEDHAYIGTGAILRQGEPGKPLIIGAGATVGMGAVVTKDVPPGVTVVGNPARPLVKSE